jgi:hypothetical protein
MTSSFTITRGKHFLISLLFTNEPSVAKLINYQKHSFSLRKTSVSFTKRQ